MAPGSETVRVEVDAADRQREVAVDVDRYARLLADALDAEGVVGPGEVTLTFIDRDAIGDLNATHMGSTGATDVLSFPIDGTGALRPDEHRMVGDVVVCPAVARDQAAEHAGDTDAELALLVVHGALHLCGHDHADDGDRDRMWARERELLDDLWGPLFPRSVAIVMLAVTFTTLDLWLVVLIVVLILVSGVLALAETAITRTSRAKAQALVDQGVTGAERLRAVVDNLERDLNSLFLVLLVAQTVQASLTGVVAVRVFGGWGVAIATVVNIVVVFVVAEAAPKTWALQHTERAALFSAPIVAFVGRAFRLVARLLIGLTNVILPGKGLKQGPFVTEEEVLAVADEAAEAGGIDQSERELIASIIEFGDTVAREIMVPRTEMITMQADFKVSDMLEVAILNGLSRFPVYVESVDDVVGIVYAKDLMRVERDGGGQRSVRELARDAMFVPETKRVAELLREMQTRNNHIAIVIDEYGGTAGLVTLEDLLEELVGEIHDEFDVEEHAVEIDPRTGDLLVHDPGQNLDDLNEAQNLDLPTGDWDSLGGLVYAELGRVPVVGDEVDVDEYHLRVEAMDGRRIAGVRIVVPTESNRVDHAEAVGDA